MSAFRLAVVLGVALLAAPAGAQDAPRRGDDVAKRRERHRVRGIVAFKRAAYRVVPEGFDRVISELMDARDQRTGAADFRTLYLISLGYAAGGRTRDGDTVRKSAAKINPDYAGFWLLDGLQSFHDEKWEQALDQFERLEAGAEHLQVDPVTADELVFLGRVYRARTLQRMNRADEAVKALEAAVALSKKRNGEPSTAAQIYMARSHIAVTEYPRAKEILEAVLRREPSNARSYANLGLVYYDQHEHTEARKWYLEAIQRSPGLIEARERLAHIAMRRELLPEARRHLEALEAALQGLWSTRPDLRSTGAAGNVHAGFGEYWTLVAEAREQADDAAGAAQARQKAEKRFRRSLQERPGCVKALESLLGLLTDRGAGETELEALRKDLAKRQEERRVYRDTFC